MLSTFNTSPAYYLNLSNGILNNTFSKRMPRQPFSDFMDLDNLSFSPRGGRGGGGRGRGGRGNFKGNAYGGGSPSTSVTESPGRGRGRGRGGGSGFRGRGGASLRADYTAVPPIDYSRINKENYKTMTGQSLRSTPSIYLLLGYVPVEEAQIRHHFALRGCDITLF